MVFVAIASSKDVGLSNDITMTKFGPERLVTGQDIVRSFWRLLFTHSVEQSNIQILLHKLQCRSLDLLVKYLST